MANQINITPASQVATVEVNNRELSVNVQNAIKTVDVVVEARSNIAVEINRSVSLTGVQQIVAGDNIIVTPAGGTGIVTIIGTGDAATANYANFAGEAFNVNASNITGVVACANVALNALNLQAGDSSSGWSTDPAGRLVNYANSVILGQSNLYLQTNYVFPTGPTNIWNFDLNGNLTLPANTFAVNYANGSPVLLDGPVANANYSNFAGTAFNVSGSNVSGEVANANFASYSGFANLANSVAVANVVGIGNIATINLNGNPDQYLSGFGDWQAIAYSSNANYANFAGEAFNVSGANVSGEVAFAATANSVAGSNVSGPVANATHATVSDSANTVAGANVTGYVPNAQEANLAVYATTANSVAVANVVGIGNIAVVNLDGDPDYALFGDGVWRAVTTGTPNYANFAGEAFNVSGSNVTGAVANANVAEFAGTVTTNAQPNITSVGILNGLQVSSSITPNANIAYDLGNSTNRFKDIYLSGSTIYLGDETINANATGFIFSSTIAATNLNVTNVNATGNITSTKFYAAPGANESVGYGFTGAANNDTAICLTNTDEITIYNNAIESLTLYANNNSKFYGNLQANLYIGDGGGLSNIIGANVNGAVAFATTANAVAIANVSGIGNIAVINLDGNSGNILYGNGVFSAVPDVANSNTANYANYANFAGEAFSVTGSNVVGEVANANYATFAGTSYSVSGANVSGTVANATHAVSSDSSNGVSGSNVVGQVGNALIAGTVYDNAQPNITSVGTLTTLSVTGGITSFANITGDYFLGNGAFLTGVGDFSAALGYHGSFYSNVTQTIASTTTAYPITLNNTSAGTYGVFVASNSRVTFTYAGTYNIQYSIQFTNTDNALQDASVWLRKNGVDVPDSNSVFGVTAKRGAINGQLIGAINYIEDVSANDYYELIWQAENTSVSLEYIPPGTTPTSPAAPSVIVTAMQVTNVQAATLSGNLTGNLIGNTFGLTGTSFINIIGNISGNVFTGNANGLTGIVGANVSGFVANATHATISDAANVAYSVSGANVSGFVANATHATVSDSSNSVTGGNVIGAVGLATFATTANAVAVANVSGIGNISVINLNGNGSQILAGNGAWINTPNTASANYANFAGEAFNVTGSNVTGAVGLATFATTANAVAGANVSGEVSFAATANSVAGANVSGAVAYATTANSVAVANVSGIGNIAVVNLTGSSSNVLYGNGVFAAASGGSGTPGGANTELQYNNNGAFGGISTVTWNGSNISLGAIGNVKITGGSNNYILATDGTGNLSFSTKTNNLTIGTRTVSVNIPITDYTMNVQGRTGNIVVNVN